jgi:alcohol dehydrogenase YqhD (iron-dependent ADH family)
MELTREELDMVIEVFDFYVEHKLNKDSATINKYLDYAEKIGVISQVEQKYVETKKFYDTKHKIREHIEMQIRKFRELRNKILNHFILKKN